MLVYTQIDFLLASDGKPWVWVMGEHKDDTPYDAIVNEYINNLIWKSVFLFMLFQVQRRELKKQEDEKLAEIVEAEKLTKTGIISVISKDGCII